MGGRKKVSSSIKKNINFEIKKRKKGKRRRKRSQRGRSFHIKNMKGKVKYLTAKFYSLKPGLKVHDKTLPVVNT